LREKERAKPFDQAQGRENTRANSLAAVPHLWRAPPLWIMASSLKASSSTKDFHSILASYDYPLPPELLAKEPASPRDSAKLLIFDRANQSVRFDVFRNVQNYLPRDCVLVLNQTKVIPAKIMLKKQTGGTVSVLFLSKTSETITVLASGSLRPGDTLAWERYCTFSVKKRNDREAVLVPSVSIEQFLDLLRTHGETPLPPYLKDSPLKEDRRRTEYQTVFARKEGSVAAPTAGLHFTEHLLMEIEKNGRAVVSITLHVNLGTFAPLTEEQWREGKLHTEYYSIDQHTAEVLAEAKKQHRPIVAVGTTTVRALESASDGITLKNLTGSTDLFITENYQPHFVDHLITNFHVPKSSLMMLVSAFTGRQKLLDLYQQAIGKRMRFFSFGDAMIIL
jgi:S-adenosylmethionine:tRNA ribosyltransferase-isomerase